MAVVSPPGNSVRDGPDPPPSRWSGALGDVHHKPAVPLLYIERSAFTGDFVLADRTSWEHLDIKHDAGDTTLTIAAQTDVEDLADPGQLGTRHLTHMLDKLHPDMRVMLREPEPSRRVIFDGYIQTRGFAWSPRRQGVSATAQDRMEVWLDEARECQLWGRWMRKNPLAAYVETNPDLRLVSSLPLHFNPQGKPNRLFGGIVFGGDDDDGDERTVDVFVDEHEPGAQHWTVVQALGYLLHFYVRAADRIPIDLTKFWDDHAVIRLLAREQSDPDRFRRRMRSRMPDMRLDAVSLREALVTICASAGLHVRFPIEMGEDDDGNETWTHALRIYVRGKTGVNDPQWKMRQPAALDQPREGPHTPVTGREAKSVAQGNVAEQVAITFDHQSVNEAVALGGVEYYEVTLGLVPGWLPFKLIDQGDGPAYVHYPELLNPPTDEDGVPINVLDDVTQDEASITAAKKWWLDLLTNEKDDDKPDRPVHPLHGRNVQQNKTLFDIVRLWIFPTDVRRGKLDFEDVSEWQRDQHFYHPQLDCEALDLEEFGGTGLNRLALPTPGGELPDAADWVARARRIFDVPSDIGSGGHRPPLVQISWDSGATWQDANELTDFLTHECGLRFKAENLTAVKLATEPADAENMIYAIIEHRFRVRVTCLIAGDDRIQERRLYRAQNKVRRTAKTYDLGERFKLRDLGSGNSAYRDGKGIQDWQFRTIDDREPMGDWLGSQGQQVSVETVSGNPDIPWIELGIEPGDLITGIRGIGISFPSPAEVAGIRITREGLKTTLFLTDYRDDADVEQGALA